jgi:hypothetical protein
MNKAQSTPANRKSYSPKSKPLKQTTAPQLPQEGLTVPRRLSLIRPLVPNKTSLAYLSGAFLFGTFI